LYRLMRAVGLTLVLLGFTTPEAGAQPGRLNYYSGDWTSWVVMRHVSGFAQSFDLLYMATPNGVGRYHPISRRWLPPLTASSGLDDPRIIQIAWEEETQTLWVETPQGPYSYNDVLDEWRREFEFPVGLVRDDAVTLRYENLFTPFEVSYHTRSKADPYGTFIDRNLRRYPITSALADADRRHITFIGTWGFGLGEINEDTYNTEFIPNGPYQDVVQVLHKDGDLWYMAGQGDSEPYPVISIFNGRDSTWAYEQPYYSVAAKGDVTCIASMDELIFFGTPFGLLQHDRKKNQWRKYDHVDGLPDYGITALFTDDKLLWVGTQKGPGLLDPYADTGQAAISLATGTIGTPWVYKFVRWQEHVWAGTHYGLFRINQADGDWSRIVSETGFLRGQVRDLVIQPEGLWCATDLGLLLLDDNLQAAETFRNGVELTQGDLFALAADGANIWASSPIGVWRYNRLKESFRLYTRADGLLEDFAFDIVLDGPYVWFATVGGVTRFLWNSPQRVD
jgi:hypothetical protein